MKSWLSGTLFTVFLYGVASAMPLCNYHSPQTELSDLKIQFSYHYVNNPYGLQDWDVDAGELKLSYDRLSESPDVGFDIVAKSDMTISLVGLSTFLATIEGNIKRYLSPDTPYFGFAGGGAESASDYERIGISSKLGIGYGRFRDVTPLAKAVRINNQLLERGSLSEHMNDVDLETLAYEIDSLSLYDSLGDLLDVLKEVIEGSGYVKPGGLDALDIYEIAQIVEDDQLTRYCGGDARLSLGYEIIDPQGDPNDLLAEAAFNYAFTTTPQEQFLARGSFSSLSGAFELLRAHKIELRLSYDYALNKLITFLAAYDFERERWEDVPTDRHNLSLTVQVTPIESAMVTLDMAFGHEPYFLEWSADITLGLSVDLL
jgi:hypothetical protein